MAYRLVIFDFDGTLADSASWMLKVLNRVAAKHRFRSVTEEEAQMLRGLGNREILAYLGVQKWRLPWIAGDMRSRSAAMASEIPLFAGVAGLIADLWGRGIVIAVVSSNSEATIRQVLGPENAARIAHYRCGVSLFGKARKLRELVRQIGAVRDEVLCVGDETRDIEAARAAGLAIASVTWGYATADALRACEPTLMVGSIDELAAAIRA